MAAKRNSHTYVCEDAPRKDPQQQLPLYTSHRSRRSSRSSTTKEEVSKTTDDMQRSNAVSVREAATLARGQNTLAVATDTAVTNALRSKDTMSSKISVSSMSTTSTTSTETSPASKSDRPHNFGIVVPGVYRSSYPKSDDFEYIKSLKLKTIVTLVKKEELDGNLETFVTSNGIRQVIFNMKGTKKEAIPPKTMKAILSVILDRQNHPLLIHCNHGKHRTGCVVGVVRKLSGWDTESVVDEYRTYAQPKIREVDVAYLEAFQISSLSREAPGPRQVGELAPIRSPSQQRTFFRALLLSIVFLGIWMFSGSQLTVAAARGDRLL